MICDQHKTIFIHIPRNAGASIKHALGGKQLIQGNQYPTISEIQKLKLETINSFHKWTIVRNPWEREISLYRYAIESNIIKSISFKDYLKKIKAKEIKNKIITTNQIEYFTNEGYVEVDQIVRLEYIDGTWLDLCEKLSIKQSALSHINKSTLSNQQYDQECIDLVKQIRKADIEFLNYDCPY